MNVVHRSCKGDGKPELDVGEGRLSPLRLQEYYARGACLQERVSVEIFLHVQEPLVEGCEVGVEWKTCLVLVK